MKTITGILIEYDKRMGKGLVKAQDTGKEYYLEDQEILKGLPIVGSLVVFEPSGKSCLVPLCEKVILIPNITSEATN